MISRDLGRFGYTLAGQYNPPPLHVYSPEAEHAAWHPVQRARFAPQHPGPVMVHIPAPGGFAGDDPTDPTAQTIPRVPTIGMIGRFHAVGTRGRQK